MAGGLFQDGLLEGGGAGGFLSSCSPHTSPADAVLPLKYRWQSATDCSHVCRADMNPIATNTNIAQSGNKLQIPLRPPGGSMTVCLHGCESVHGVGPAKEGQPPPPPPEMGVSSLRTRDIPTCEVLIIRGAS
ncbi:hypothetical protein AAFF_G00433150 [Aldrovandia affinis]|uniref:Uncharacterized protein n=1 Tax=Aldrovandia affinis TaxID=143900 RepID=A0AAD7S8X3_9TELE|nr:hypothetical protein AAFF_G00433150 [Aldrovandia affinis]